MNKIFCLFVGIAIISITICCANSKHTANEVTTNKPFVKCVETKAAPNEKQIPNVPYICQYPDFPTGCEAVSAVMVLNYLGFDITAGDFADYCLPQSTAFYYDFAKHGPNPNEYFVGNPRTNESYGCYAPVIKKAVELYVGNRAHVTDTSGTGINDLCKKYVCNDIPVIIWASINMIETYKSDSWLLDDGSEFWWIANEHCVVLTGYDGEYYYFNDPIGGSNIAYEKSLVEKRYNELNRQSIVITK